MRRAIIRIGAVLAIVGVGWYLWTSTFRPLHNAIFNPDPTPPGATWCLAKACSALLGTGMIVLLAAIIVRSPRKEA